MDVVQEFVEELVPGQVAEKAVTETGLSGVQAVAKAILALKVRQYEREVLRHHTTPEGQGGGQKREVMGEGRGRGTGRVGGREVDTILHSNVCVPYQTTND